jgi:alkanesulfonate monooxygenase SsuD/methylene tetrahydromethanopterin reductase-like flavin-dependent oxidoreductase (luciferase family)
VTLRIFVEPQQGASYDQLLAVARTAEDLGFGAFFRSDHLLKMGQVSGLPAVTDAWITLAGLARDTTSIRLGTMVTPVTFRGVGTFVATAAQVDTMSGGRLEIGLGAGWYDAEHRAFGIPFPAVASRYDLLEDQLEILHGTWSTPPEATFEYRGSTTSVAISADTVRPQQSPHPPLILGGQAGNRSAHLAARFADEYNSAFHSVDTTKAVHDRVRRAAGEAERDPASIVYSAAQVLCCGESEAEIARRAATIGREVDELRTNGLAGTPAEVVEKIGRFAAAGVDRFYLQVLDIADHDHLRLVAAEVMPHVPGK